MNWLSVACGVLQLGAAIEAAVRRNWAMAVVFLCYAICSVLLAKVK